jgi:hypothetical protein
VGRSDAGAAGGKANLILEPPGGPRQPAAQVLRFVAPASLVSRLAQQYGNFLQAEGFLPHDSSPCWSSRLQAKWKATFGAFWFSCFGFVSDFGFEIRDLVMPVPR